MRSGDLVIIGVSVGLALGILIASLVFLGIRWYKRRANLRRCANERSPAALPIRVNGMGTSMDFSAPTSTSTVKSKKAINSRLSWWTVQTKDQFASASGIPVYSYKDIQKATQNFTTALGQGYFGPVYKATMATGGVAAVKVLASHSKQGEREFQTEVSVLGRCHHRNLVNLIGCCVDKGQHMLIYEFMSHGSLANLLYSMCPCNVILLLYQIIVHPVGHCLDQNEQALSWEVRLQIALDISHGIEYLHDGAVPPVIHRDLKSANILLDRTMRAKVADFGLSKEQSFDGHNSSLKGTYGYIDPAYISTNKFTTKSDVYSFGIILFELITAINPQQNLMEYINLAAMSPDGVDEIVDERLNGDCKIEEVRRLAGIAHRCLHKVPRKRPSIAEVSQAIVNIKQSRLVKNNTMSFAEEEMSCSVSRIESQQMELSKLASINEKITV